MIIVTSNGERYKLRAGQNRIGRGADCDLQVEANDVSRHHAIISFENGKVQIMDLGSTNGTSLNGRKLEEYDYQPLSAGDSILLGNEKGGEYLNVEEDDQAEMDIAAASTVVMNAKDLFGGSQEGQKVSPEMISAAYEALASGDMSRIKEYWDADIAWLIPGSNPLAGWHRGLNAFIDYMRQVGKLTNNNLKTQSMALMVGDGYSATMSKVVGYRAGYNEGNAQKPDTKLEVDLVQILRWRNGKIVEGRSAVFGEGSAEYDRFWSFNGAGN
jgi:ketosteroid isomerase-like protein